MTFASATAAGQEMPVIKRHTASMTASTEAYATTRSVSAFQDTVDHIVQRWSIVPSTARRLIKESVRTMENATARVTILERIATN